MKPPKLIEIIDPSIYFPPEDKAFIPIAPGIKTYTPEETYRACIEQTEEWQKLSAEEKIKNIINSRLTLKYLSDLKCTTELCGKETYKFREEFIFALLQQDYEDELVNAVLMNILIADLFPCSSESTHIDILKSTIITRLGCHKIKELEELGDLTVLYPFLNIPAASTNWSHREIAILGALVEKNYTTLKKRHHGSFLKKCYDSLYPWVIETASKNEVLATIILTSLQDHPELKKLVTPHVIKELVKAGPTATLVCLKNSSLRSKLTEEQDIQMRANWIEQLRGQEQLILDILQHDIEAWESLPLESRMELILDSPLVLQEFLNADSLDLLRKSLSNEHFLFLPKLLTKPGELITKLLLKIIIEHENIPNESNHCLYLLLLSRPDLQREQLIATLNANSEVDSEFILKFYDDFHARELNSEERDIILSLINYPIYDSDTRQEHFYPNIHPNYEKIVFFNETTDSWEYQPDFIELTKKSEIIAELLTYYYDPDAFINRWYSMLLERPQDLIDLMQIYPAIATPIASRKDCDLARIVYQDKTTLAGIYKALLTLAQNRPEIITTFYFNQQCKSCQFHGQNVWDQFTAAQKTVLLESHPNIILSLLDGPQTNTSDERDAYHPLRSYSYREFTDDTMKWFYYIKPKNLSFIVAKLIQQKANSTRIIKILTALLEETEIWNNLNPATQILVCRQVSTEAITQAKENILAALDESDAATKIKIEQQYADILLIKDQTLTTEEETLLLALAQDDHEHPLMQERLSSAFIINGLANNPWFRHMGSQGIKDLACINPAIASFCLEEDAMIAYMGEDEESQAELLFDIVESHIKNHPELACLFYKNRRNLFDKLPRKQKRILYLRGRLKVLGQLVLPHIAKILEFFSPITARPNTAELFLYCYHLVDLPLEEFGNTILAENSTLTASQVEAAKANYQKYKHRFHVDQTITAEELDIIAQLAADDYQGLSISEYESSRFSRDFIGLAAKNETIALILVEYGDNNEWQQDLRREDILTIIKAGAAVTLAYLKNPLLKEKLTDKQNAQVYVDFSKQLQNQKQLIYDVWHNEPDIWNQLPIENQIELISNCPLILQEFLNDKSLDVAKIFSDNLYSFIVKLIVKPDEVSNQLLLKIILKQDRWDIITAHCFYQIIFSRLPREQIIAIRDQISAETVSDTVKNHLQTLLKNYDDLRQALTQTEYELLLGMVCAPLTRFFLSEETTPATALRQNQHIVQGLYKTLLFCAPNHPKLIASFYLNQPEAWQEFTEIQKSTLIYSNPAIPLCLLEILSEEDYLKQPLPIDDETFFTIIAELMQELPEDLRIQKILLKVLTDSSDNDYSAAKILSYRYLSTEQIMQLRQKKLATIKPEDVEAQQEIEKLFSEILYIHGQTLTGAEKSFLFALATENYNEYYLTIQKQPSLETLLPASEEEDDDDDEEGFSFSSDVITMAIESELIAKILYNDIYLKIILETTISRDPSIAISLMRAHKFVASCNLNDLLKAIKYQHKDELTNIFKSSNADLLKEYYIILLEQCIATNPTKLAIILEEIQASVDIDEFLRSYPDIINVLFTNYSDSLAILSQEQRIKLMSRSPLKLQHFIDSPLELFKEKSTLMPDLLSQLMITDTKEANRLLLTIISVNYFYNNSYPQLKASINEKIDHERIEQIRDGLSTETETQQASIILSLLIDPNHKLSWQELQSLIEFNPAIAISYLEGDTSLASDSSMAEPERVLSIIEPHIKTHPQLALGFYIKYVQEGYFKPTSKKLVELLCNSPTLLQYLSEEKNFRIFHAKTIFAIPLTQLALELLTRDEINNNKLLENIIANIYITDLILCLILMSSRGVDHELLKRAINKRVSSLQEKVQSSKLPEEECNAALSVIDFLFSKKSIDYSCEAAWTEKELSFLEKLTVQKDHKAKALCNPSDSYLMEEVINTAMQNEKFACTLLINLAHEVRQCFRTEDLVRLAQTHSSFITTIISLYNHHHFSHLFKRDMMFPISSIFTILINHCNSHPDDIIAANFLSKIYDISLLEASLPGPYLGISPWDFIANILKSNPDKTTLKPLQPFITKYWINLSLTDKIILAHITEDSDFDEITKLSSDTKLELIKDMMTNSKLRESILAHSADPKWQIEPTIINTAVTNALDTIDSEAVSTALLDILQCENYRENLGHAALILLVKKINSTDITDAEARNIYHRLNISPFTATAEKILKQLSFIQITLDRETPPIDLTEEEAENFFQENEDLWYALNSTSKIQLLVNCPNLLKYLAAAPDNLELLQHGLNSRKFMTKLVIELLKHDTPEIKTLLTTMSESEQVLSMPLITLVFPYLPRESQQKIKSSAILEALDLDAELLTEEDIAKTVGARYYNFISGYYNCLLPTTPLSEKETEILLTIDKEYDHNLSYESEDESSHHIAPEIIEAAKHNETLALFSIKKLAENENLAYIYDKDLLTLIGSHSFIAFWFLYDIDLNIHLYSHCKLAEILKIYLSHCSSNPEIANKLFSNTKLSEPIQQFLTLALNIPKEQLQEGTTPIAPEAEAQLIAALLRLPYQVPNATYRFLFVAENLGLKQSVAALGNATKLLLYLRARTVAAELEPADEYTQLFTNWQNDRSCGYVEKLLIQLSYAEAIEDKSLDSVTLTNTEVLACYHDTPQIWRQLSEEQVQALANKYPSIDTLLKKDHAPANPYFFFQESTQGPSPESIKKPKPSSGMRSFSSFLDL